MAQTARTTTRRTMIAAAGAAGLTAALAACGDDSGNASDPGAPSSDQQSTGAQSTPEESSGGGRDFGPASAVPVGGGKIFDDQVVVTQPAQGQYKAFSAICTHQGCPVSTVENGTINCPCHGSKFRIDDGGVSAGPATKPLEALKVRVEGGSLKVS
ncbi:Rieske (2Fe-2S) protein [Streptomyces capparidis]